jgi:O-methyltransferase domain/Dimerisation domain
MSRTRMTEILFGVMIAKTIYAASELRIPDLLTEGKRTTADLAERTGAHERSLRRLLRALACVDVVVEQSSDCYELTEFGALLRSDTPDSMAALVRARCGPDYWKSWGELGAAIRTGKSGWELAHGMSWIEFYELHPGRWSDFNAHMSQHTKDAAPGIVAGYDFSRLRTIVDLGGGDGTLLVEILRAYAGVQGVVFDLPGVVASAQASMVAAGVSDRCDVVGGDFFKGIPGGADAYLMKFILHDWGDERASAILRRCRDAMTSDGRVLVVERVLPEHPAPADMDPVLYDMLMLVATGGSERTETEFRELFESAGLALVSTTPPLPPFRYRVLEGVPA